MSAHSEIIDELAKIKRDLTKELLNCKRELTNSIEASEARITLKLKDINSEVKDLESENKLLKIRVEQLDREARKNSLIIFGLEHNNSVSINYVCAKLNDLLDLNLNDQDFNDSRLLGTASHCPIKIDLLSYHKKRLVLQNCKKLKGTNIIITHDLTETQRQEGKILRKHLVNQRKKNTGPCYIRGNKLYINGKSYTIEELTILEDSEGFIEEIVSEKENEDASESEIRDNEQDKYSLYKGNNASDIKTRAKKKEDLVKDRLRGKQNK